MTILLLAILVGAQTCPAATQLAHTNNWYDAKPIVETILAGCPLADPYVQKVLIERLDRENADPKWFERAEDTNFENYNGDLAEAVQKIASEHHAPLAFRALVRANYNEDSEFAQWLLQRSDAVLPWLLEGARGTDRRVGDRAIIMLGEALGECEKPGAKNCTNTLSRKSEILALLRDKAKMESANIADANTRTSAFEALGFCGERQDLKLLEQLSGDAAHEYTVQKAKAQIEARLQ